MQTTNDNEIDTAFLYAVICIWNDCAPLRIHLIDLINAAMVLYQPINELEYE